MGGGAIALAYDKYNYVHCVCLVYSLLKSYIRSAFVPMASDNRDLSIKEIACRVCACMRAP